jgi:RNA polymerase sigma-70 factor (sigma-E family)
MEDIDRRADFTAYVRAREQRLARLAYLLTGNRDTADDLLQNVLSKVYRHWHRIAAVEQPDAYVRRMMVNENNSRWRQFARRLDTPASHVIDVVEAPAPAGMDRGEAIDLWNQVQSLPRQQRAVVVLRFYEDLSEAQTAEVLGCSVGTVKSHTSRALGALRTRMSEATA